MSTAMTADRIVRRGLRLLPWTVVCVLAALVVPAAGQAERGLYVSNFGSDDLSAFALGASGLPSPFLGSPFAAGNGPAGVAATPDGRFLYGGNRLEIALRGYGLDAAGAPTPLPDSPFTANGAYDGAAITPDGSRIYFTNTLSGTIHGFDLAGDGTPTPLVPPAIASGTGPNGIAIAPNGRYLYVANEPGQVSGYEIGADGSLSELPDSPHPIGGGATAIVIRPDGGHLYVTSIEANRIYGFAIAADGSLSAAPGSPYAGSAAPNGAAMIPDGSRLYTTSIFFGVYGFDVAADGSLSLVPGSPFADRTPVGDFRPLGIAANPAGRRLYVANSQSDDITTFDVAGDGSLAPAPGSPTPLGGESPGTFAVAIQPAQGPQAALALSRTGASVRFDASGSSDPDGSVARYDWRFGDGTSLPDGGPTPTHAYGTGGDFTATVTVSDEEGCSIKRLFTGQTVSCNGSSAAAASATVAIPRTPGGPPDRPDPPKSARRSAIAAGLALVRNGKALLKLRCPGLVACRGKARLVVTLKGGQRARRAARQKVLLGAARFSVPAGKAKTVPVPLRRKGKALLRRAGKSGLRARLAGKGVKGRTVLLKPARAGRR